MTFYSKGDKGLHSALASHLSPPHFSRMRGFFLCLLCFSALVRGETLGDKPSSENPPVSNWAERAVWYQIFPERFHNADTKNDPTPEYCRIPDKVRSRWTIIPWTKEWYALTDWEKELAGDVYGTNAHRRYGGDFQGVIDKLDYLQDLGVTALY
ncbi:MAG: hypothetical protein RLZZ112_948, partial [Verrucomicrobiota bacterium]